ncbi:vacuolar import and degradation protein, partial [Planoprotostelium fungivorum]
GCNDCHNDAHSMPQVTRTSLKPQRVDRVVQVIPEPDDASLPHCHELVLASHMYDASIQQARANMEMSRTKGELWVCSIEIQRTAEFKYVVRITGFSPGEDRQQEETFDISDMSGFTKEPSPSADNIYSWLGTIPERKRFFVEFDDGEKQNGHDFEHALCKALYESRYQASSARVSRVDLSQFIETNRESSQRTPARGIPDKSPTTPAKALDASVKTVTPTSTEEKITTPNVTPVTPSEGNPTPNTTTTSKSPIGNMGTGSVRPHPRVKFGTNYPVLEDTSNGQEAIVLSPKSELYQYDSQENQYVLRDAVKCSRVSLGDRKKSFIYDLVIHRFSDNKLLLRIRISSDLNMTFHHARSTKEGSITWTEKIEGVTWAWSLAFDRSTEQFFTFESAYKEALWETNSQKPHSSLKADDQKYVDFRSESEEDEESESDAEVEDEFDRFRFGQSEPEKVRVARAMEEPTEGISASRNQLLAVGGKNDRTFVSRGSRIGVFKNKEDDVEFVSTIDRLKTPDGKYFSPKRMVLHKEEKSMLFLPGEVKGSTPSNKVVYKMDLERPDNLGVHPVQELFHQTKFGEMKDQDNITGLNLNGFVHVDPRTRDKVVNSHYYAPTTKPELSCAATTKTGDLVAGSKKGEIRMYSSRTFESSACTLRAKTNLPGFGDPILSIETTEDGEWILATCKNYLVVLRSENKGINGFKKPLGKEKPVLKRLQLSQVDIVNMGGHINFTPAARCRSPANNRWSSFLSKCVFEVDSSTSGGRSRLGLNCSPSEQQKPTSDLCCSQRLFTSSLDTLQRRCDSSFSFLEALYEPQTLQDGSMALVLLIKEFANWNSCSRCLGGYKSSAEVLCVAHTMCRRSRDTIGDPLPHGDVRRGWGRMTHIRTKEDPALQGRYAASRDLIRRTGEIQSLRNYLCRAFRVSSSYVFRRVLVGLRKLRQEKAIVTSTGPYVVTWDFSKIKKGICDAYDVKEYSEDIIGGQFKYKSDKSIVVATDNNVSMASRNRLIGEFGDR